MAEGFLHEFQGWMVFMVSAALMVGEMALLNRIGKESGTWRSFSASIFRRRPRGRRSAHASCRPASSPPAECSLDCRDVAALPRPAEIIPAARLVRGVSDELGRWRGQRYPLEASIRRSLKLDDYLLADFTDGAGEAVNLYIAYYNSQRKGEAVHSPRSCLPGGGWQMQDFGQRAVPGVLVGGVPLRVNRTVIELGDQRQLVYYWFQQRGPDHHQRIRGEVVPSSGTR